MKVFLGVMELIYILIVVRLYKSTILSFLELYTQTQKKRKNKKKSGLFCLII